MELERHFLTITLFVERKITLVWGVRTKGERIKSRLVPEGAKV